MSNRLKINNINKIYFLLILFLLTPLFVSAQTNSKDSLATKSFDELRKIFYHYKNTGQKETGKKIALYTLNKAREENNTAVIANSFIRLCRVSYDTPEIALKYIDSSIVVSSKIKNNKLIAGGNFYKGIVLSDMRKYDESLKSYMKALNYFKNDGGEMYYFTLSNIGEINLRIRNNETALEIYKEILNHEKEKKEFSTNYIKTLYSLSLAYSANDQIDSTSIINKEGYNLALDNNEFSHLHFTHAEAGVQFLKGNYAAAKDSLKKAIPYLKEIEDIPNLSIAYFYMGMISDNEHDKIKYYEKVDSIYTNSKFILPSFWTLYEELIDFYKKKNDLKKQLYYTQRLLKIDTVLKNEYINVKEIIHKEYDIPRLVEDKESLILLLNKKNKSFKYGNWILLIIVIVLSFGLWFIYRKKVKNESNFLKIISSLEEKNLDSKKSITEKKVSQRPLLIDSETLNNILSKLEEFEKNKDFLTPKLTLNAFAKKIDTNSKYLSMTINNYKSQTFKNYINNLRVKYIVDRLYSDHILRNYTINAIATEAGFSSTESFTRAFNKKTGLNVSYFLKKINN